LGGSSKKKIANADSQSGTTQNLEINKFAVLRGEGEKKSPKILRESKVHKKDGESIIRVQRKNLPNIPNALLR
jgi:hypothetical protein